LFLYLLSLPGPTKPAIRTGPIYHDQSITYSVLCTTHQIADRGCEENNQKGQEIERRGRGRGRERAEEEGKGRGSQHIQPRHLIDRKGEQQTVLPWTDLRAGSLPTLLIMGIEITSIAIIFTRPQQAGMRLSSRVSASRAIGLNPTKRQLSKLLTDKHCEQA
jgi:hypothetical protein